MEVDRGRIAFVFFTCCAWTVSAFSDGVTPNPHLFARRGESSSRLGGSNVHDEVWVWTEQEALQALEEAEDNQLIHLELGDLHLIDTVVLRVSTFAIRGRPDGTRVHCPPSGSAFVLEGSGVTLENLSIEHCNDGHAVSVGVSFNQMRKRCPRHLESRRNIQNELKQEVYIKGCNFTGNQNLNGAAIAVTDGLLTIERSRFRDNFAEFGSAISLLDSVVTITKCVFTQTNRAATCGGTIGGVTSKLVIRESRFEKNSAASGGAISVHNSTVDIGSTLFQNISALEGGAIKLDQASRLRISVCVFYNNSAKTGGAIQAQNDSTVAVTGSVFERNHAEGDGGVFYIAGNSEFSMEYTTVRGSFAHRGGAVAANESKVTINRSNLTALSAVDGGVLHLNQSTCCVRESSKIENNSAQFGGAVFMMKGSQLKVQQSSFLNNSASLGESVYAACAYPDECVLGLYDTKFVGTTDSQLGGALYLVGLELNSEKCRFLKQEAQ